MASAENTVQTSNTSMSEGQSEGHQEPPSNDGALDQDKRSSSERFGPRDHVDDNPPTPDLSAQPTTSGLLSNEGR